MIKFEKIKWRNLLSTGNIFTEIQLDAHQNALIVGENGAGKCVRKSTEIDIQIEDPTVYQKYLKFLAEK